MRWLTSLFRGDRSAAATAAKKKPASSGPAEVYLGLRSQVLQLSSAPPASALNHDSLLAILMETGYPEAVATLMSNDDGSTSLYFSNGGGMIGLGQRPPIASAARTFREKASGEFASAMTLTHEFPLPAVGRVRFYLVYPGRILTAEAAENDLGYKRHALWPLFHAGQDVITQIRLHSGQ